MFIMTKNRVTAVRLLAIMFVHTNQDELFGNSSKKITQCPNFDQSGFVKWNDLHRWCPPFLARAMKQICCGKYNNPPEAYNSNRRKLLIIDECCSHCCTAKYLKHSYCNDSSVDNRKLYIPPTTNENTEIYERY